MEPKTEIDADICPYCRSTMKKGYIAGGRDIWWIDSEKEYSSFDLGTNLAHSYVSRVKVNAKRCDKCNLIIIKTNK